MDRKEFKHYSIGGQVVLWGIYLLMSVLYDIDSIGFFPALAYGLTFVLMSMVVVYVHYHRLLPLLFKKRYFRYALFTLLFITMMNAIYILVDDVLPFDYPIEQSYITSYGYNLLSLIFIVMVSSVFYYVREWYLGREREERLRAESLQTELHFLRSQINPHFLFNTLNNIYSYAQTGNPKTAPMIERLSGILRFMVYDGNSSTVALNKEIEVIGNLLEIQRMKSSSSGTIELVCQGNKGYHLVAPLILINLMENACKHSNATSNPEGFIKSSITVLEGDNLHFSIANSIKENTGSTTLKNSGVGLSNIKKRLALLYANDYSLKEQNNGKVYQLDLRIPLERKR